MMDDRMRIATSLPILERAYIPNQGHKRVLYSPLLDHIDMQRLLWPAAGQGTDEVKASQVGG
jgi:hypothetical protein